MAGEHCALEALAIAWPGSGLLLRSLISELLELGRLRSRSMRIKANQLARAAALSPLALTVLLSVSLKGRQAVLPSPAEYYYILA